MPFQRDIIVQFAPLVAIPPKAKGKVEINERVRRRDGKLNKITKVDPIFQGVWRSHNPWLNCTAHSSS